MQHQLAPAYMLTAPETPIDVILIVISVVCFPLGIVMICMGLGKVFDPIDRGGPVIAMGVGALTLPFFAQPLRDVDFGNVDMPSQETESANLDFDGTIILQTIGGIAGLLAALGIGYLLLLFGAKHLRKREEQKQAANEAQVEIRTLNERYRKNIKIVGSYETDITKAINYPAFNDINVPEVSAMSKAMQRATDAHRQINQDQPEKTTLQLRTEYRDAVNEFNNAVHRAMVKAHEIRWETIPTEDKKDLEQAQALLTQAKDPGTPDKQRGVLYEQLKRVINRLNKRRGSDVIPTKGLQEIEEQHRLLLEAPKPGETIRNTTNSKQKVLNR